MRNFIQRSKYTYKDYKYNHFQCQYGDQSDSSMLIGKHTPVFVVTIHIKCQIANRQLCIMLNLPEQRQIYVYIQPSMLSLQLANQKQFLPAYQSPFSGLTHSMQSVYFLPFKIFFITILFFVVLKTQVYESQFNVNQFILLQRKQYEWIKRFFIISPRQLISETKHNPFQSIKSLTSATTKISFLADLFSLISFSFIIFSSLSLLFPQILKTKKQATITSSIIGCEKGSAGLIQIYFNISTIRQSMQYIILIFHRDISDKQVSCCQLAIRIFVQLAQPTPFHVVRLAIKSKDHTFTCRNQLLQARIFFNGILTSLTYALFNAKLKQQMTVRIKKGRLDFQTHQAIIFFNLVYPKFFERSTNF